MMRNDYRRSLILLRSGSSGYSGHVRLERRTLTGSMVFLVRTPGTQERLEAALVGAGRNGYFACPLGPLRRDGRGQAVLNYTFDPQNICARALEDYAVLAVSEITGSNCRIVLFGNVNGHAEIDWRQACAALCRLYAAGDVCRQQISVPDPETTRGETGDEGIPEAAETVPGTEAAILPEVTEEAVAETEAPLPALPEEQVSEMADEPAPEENAAPAELQPTAGELLEMDPEIPWPESVEALRQIFRTDPPADPAPDDAYVYVSAPMPEESGYNAVLAGIRAEQGVPVAVSYALPAVWSAEPPAGLEDYAWSGDQNRGWWVAREDLRTGTRI